MRRFVGVLLLCAATCCLYTGCDEDSSRNMVPHNPLGVIVGIGAEEGEEPLENYPLAMMWVDGDVATDLFSVYLKTGDSGYEKVNSDVVRRGPIFGIAMAPSGLGFIDYTFDHTSASQHSYYVVATNTRGTESAASEEIVVVPADIDLAAQLTGLAPADSDTVAVNPKFSWDPIAGAATYCFVLEEETQDRGSVLRWIYRTSGTSVMLGATSGLTYLDGRLTSLRPGAEYSWSVYAVNANNCTFAASYADIYVREP